VTTPVLILSPRYTEDARLVRGAAVEAGWAVERAQGWRVERDVSDGSIWAVYGEPLFGRLIAEQLGARLLEPALDWLTGLEARWTGRVVRAMTMGQARGLEGPWFIKPADDKRFAAAVYAGGAALPELVEDDAPVLVSEVVEWEQEWRFFVVDGVARAGSIYLRGGELAEDEAGEWPAGEEEQAAAWGFIAALLEAVEVGPCVVDVGVMRGRGWGVIEANPAFGAGIYGCDPACVLEVLARCVARG
jgi:hypothetical protein